MTILLRKTAPILYPQESYLESGVAIPQISAIMISSPINPPLEMHRLLAYFLKYYFATFNIAIRIQNVFF